VLLNLDLSWQERTPNLLNARYHKHFKQDTLINPLHEIDVEKIVLQEAGALDALASDTDQA